jgi:outer membrane protein OmpA-like peptidoglycan-associated protein
VSGIARGIGDDRGCPKDSDGDGVPDSLDKCPGTAAGARVDIKGCPLSNMETELLDTGKLRLESVYFDVNMATIKPESYPALDEVGQVLTNWPDLRIEVGGHTDSMGEDNYNRNLSEARAKAVLEYLTSKFSSTRINTRAGVAVRASRSPPTTPRRAARRIVGWNSPS